MKLPFKTNDLILFAGDSITDCGRDRGNPDSLGHGYVEMIVSRLRAEHSGLHLRFRNTGISGDRICDLLARLQRDCIDLRPDWISLLIGVNNTWRAFDSDDPTPIGIFEAQCRELLTRFREHTSARLVLCSPFLLHVDSSIAAMREDLDAKVAVLRALASEFSDCWVDFDAAFVEALRKHPPACWAGDGVHPTPAGHALMADVWFDAVCQV